MTRGLGGGSAQRNGASAGIQLAVPSEVHTETVRTGGIGAPGIVCQRVNAAAQGNGAAVGCDARVVGAGARRQQHVASPVVVAVGPVGDAAAIGRHGHAGRLRDGAAGFGQDGSSAQRAGHVGVEVDVGARGTHCTTRRNRRALQQQVVVPRIRG